MSRLHQDDLGPLFVPTNNAGMDVGRITNVTLTGKLDWWDEFTRKQAVPQIAYKGPLASDKREPNDIQVRVAGNMGSRSPWKSPARAGWRNTRLSTLSSSAWP
jgi:hypothetical protein